MAFTPDWSVVAGEVATAAKMNQLGDNDDYLLALILQQAPVGALQGYMGTTDPTGWLVCNGRNVSRSTYADLFAMFGTQFGAGDGSTTFALPNLAGRTLVMRDGSGEFPTIGSVIGAKYHTLSEHEMPHHGHGVYDPGHNHTTNGRNMAAGNDGGQRAIIWGHRYENGGFNAINPSGANIGIYGAGGNGQHNNMQPSFVANYIIKF